MELVFFFKRGNKRTGFVNYGAFVVLVLLSFFKLTLCKDNKSEELVRSFIRNISEPLKSTYYVIQIKDVLTVESLECKLYDIVKEEFDTVVGYPFGNFKSGGIKKLRGIDAENFYFTCIKSVSNFSFIDLKYYYFFFVYDEKNRVLGVAVSGYYYNLKKGFESKVVGKRTAYLLKKKLECKIISKVTFNTKIKIFE